MDADYGPDVVGPMMAPPVSLTARGSPRAHETMPEQDAVTTCIYSRELADLVDIGS